ncbi:MAG: ribokinase [Anaerolineales bacterium]|jgi:ribokinase
MAEAKVIVIGSCNMDIYSWAEHLPEPGETVIGQRYWMSMGGKGANQAVGARLLGAEVTMVGRVGDDLFGKQMLETLRSHGVNCDHLRVDSGAGSGVALVVVDKRGENIIVVVSGVNMRIDRSDVEAAASELRAADVLLMQLEIPLDAIERAIDIAREARAMCILNPAPARPLPDRILRKVHLLTPNQNEAKVLTGIRADTLEGAKSAGEALLSKGVQTVIITLSAQGALIVQPGGAQHMEGVPIEALDTTGAGDAFMAGLGVALGEGKPLEEATRYGNLIGALSTKKPGAMASLPTRAEVEAFLRNRVGPGR